MHPQKSTQHAFSCWHWCDRVPSLNSVIVFALAAEVLLSVAFEIYLHFNLTARAANMLLPNPLYTTQPIYYLWATVLIWIMDASHSNEFVLCVHAVRRTGRRQTKSFRLWREPCRGSPFPIREQEYSSARRRAPLAGSRSTTWTTVSNRSVHVCLQTCPCKFVHFYMCVLGVSQECVSVSVLLLCTDFSAPLSLPQGLETTGALDLGGASTQISFVSDHFDGSESPSNSVTFRLYGNDYNLYTHSFLCYGKDQALRMTLAHQTQVNLFLC